MRVARFSLGHEKREGLLVIISTTGYVQTSFQSISRIKPLMKYYTWAGQASSNVVLSGLRCGSWGDTPPVLPKLRVPFLPHALPKGVFLFVGCDPRKLRLARTQYNRCCRICNNKFAIYCQVFACHSIPLSNSDLQS